MKKNLQLLYLCTVKQVRRNVTYVQNLFKIVLIQITIREDDEQNNSNLLYIEITIILIYY